MREIIRSAYLSFLVTPLLIMVGIASAQTMQSGSYRIQSDSVNSFGGFSSTSNASLESTGGEIATGESTSATYSLKAGYQQMQDAFISLSIPPNVMMTPALPGITGGVANGSTSVRVLTDSAAGYLLTAQASNDPAMESASSSIQNYPTSGAPDFSFVNQNGEARFGFSPSGPDIVSYYRDDGSVCNSGTNDTSFACWGALTLTPQSIARSPSANHPAGATTTLHFRVGVGANAMVPPGTYTATTTLTAISL